MEIDVVKMISEGKSLREINAAIRMNIFLHQVKLKRGTMEIDVVNICTGKEDPEEIYKLLTLITDWCYVNKWTDSYKKLMKAEQTFNTEKKKWIKKN